MSSEDDERSAPEAGPVPGPAVPEALRLTDPKAMRALAHPVRMALLELFNVHETLTATQAGEVLGESPANCAFHLRTLAKYGYLKEAGGGRGRERPWTGAHQVITVSARDQEPQAALAAKSLGQFLLNQILDRIRRAYEAARPVGWEHASQSSSFVLYLTADETVQVAQELHEILNRRRGCRVDPSLRPADALPVEFAFFGFPRTDLIALRPEEETGK
jgi:hypothetical protein